MALLSPFGQQRCYSRACNPEPLCDLLVRESDYCQFGGTFTALLTKSLLLLSCLSIHMNLLSRHLSSSDALSEIT